MEDWFMEQYLEKAQGRNWIGERLRAWAETEPPNLDSLFRAFMGHVSASTHMAAIYNHRLIDDDVFVCNAEAGQQTGRNPAILIRGSFRERTERLQQDDPMSFWLTSRYLFEIPVNSFDEEMWSVTRAARRHYPDDHETNYQDKVSFYVQDLDVSLVFPTRYYCFAKMGDTRLLFLTAGALRQIDFSFLGNEQMEAWRQTIRTSPASSRDQHLMLIEEIEKGIAVASPFTPQEIALRKGCSARNILKHAKDIGLEKEKGRWKLTEENVARIDKKMAAEPRLKSRKRQN